MWKVAEVSFHQIGDERPTKEEASRDALTFRRKERFYSPEEPPSYLVLIGPDGEVEPLRPKPIKRKPCGGALQQPCVNDSHR